MTDLEVYEVIRAYVGRFRNWSLEVEDLTQVCFLTWWAKDPRPTVNRSYLWTLVHHEAVNMTRRLRTTVSLDLVDPDGPGPWEPEDPLDLEALQEARQTLEWVVGRVAFDPRIVTLLPPLGYLTNLEAARKLGTTAQVIAHLRHQAKSSLRVPRARYPLRGNYPWLARLVEEIGAVGGPPR